MYDLETAVRLWKKNTLEGHKDFSSDINNIIWLAKFTNCFSSYTITN